jgi:hypothetical protein
MNQRGESRYHAVPHLIHGRSQHHDERVVDRRRGPFRLSGHHASARRGRLVARGRAQVRVLQGHRRPIDGHRPRAVLQVPAAGDVGEGDGHRPGGAGHLAHVREAHHRALALRRHRTQAVNEHGVLVVFRHEPPRLWPRPASQGCQAEATGNARARMAPGARVSSTPRAHRAASAGPGHLAAIGSGPPSSRAAANSS